MSTDAAVDISRKPWLRRASDAWTTATLRAPVLTFIESFVLTHSWARAWEIVERFSSTGVNVRVERKPPQLPEAQTFYQRPGLRLLVFRVVRCRDSRTLECALSFPNGPTTSPAELAGMLDGLRLSLEAENRRIT